MILTKTQKIVTILIIVACLLFIAVSSNAHDYGKHVPESKKEETLLIDFGLTSGQYQYMTMLCGHEEQKMTIEELGEDALLYTKKDIHSNHYISSAAFHQGMVLIEEIYGTECVEGLKNTLVIKLQRLYNSVIQRSSEVHPHEGEKVHVHVEGDEHE